MHEQVISLSVLITREEYMAFVADSQRQMRHQRLPLSKGAGAVLSILGMVGLFFGRHISLSPAAAICLLLLGVVLLCYDDVLAPLFDRAAAAREYEEKQDLRMANQYRFSAESVQIQNARMTGELPLNQMTDWSQTQTLIRLSFGREVRLLLPKRVLDDTTCATICHWLEQVDSVEKNG